MNMCYNQGAILKHFVTKNSIYSSAVSKEKIYTEYISRLRPNEQKALLLYYVYGHKLNEIAEVLGETPSNVRSLSRRAKLKLRKMFEEGGDL